MDHLVIGAARIEWYGEWLPDVVRDYVSAEYDGDDKVLVCPFLVDSTRDEALALQRCMNDRGWESLIVVTSNYHTRRAKLIWRSVLAEHSPGVSLAIRGVEDGDFVPDGWWRRRQSAKTWLLETLKLGWWAIESGADF